MTLSLIVNIGIGFVIALAAIIGLAVGFCRQFSKPLVGIVAILGAIILTMILYPIIFNTGIFNSFEAKVTGWFSKEFYSREITSVETLREAIADNYLNILSGSADKLFVRMQHSLGADAPMTIGAFFARTFVNVVIEFSMWLIFYLIIKYFLYGVKYLLCKITQVVVFKSIDRILGIVWSLIWTYLIVVGVILTAGEIVVVKFLPNIEPTITQLIKDTVLLRFLHNTNVLGSFVGNILAVPLINIA